MVAQESWPWPHQCSYLPRLLSENSKSGSTSQLVFLDMKEFSSFAIITKNTAILPISLVHHTRFSKSLDTV